MNAIEKYVLDALVMLMDEKDYGSITVMDIVAKAGVSRVSYYRHFKSKEDVLRLYFAEQIEKFRQDMPYIMRSREDFFEAIFTAFKQFRDNGFFFRLLIKARLEYLYLEVLDSCMMEAKDVGRNNLPEYAAHFYAGALYNVSMQWLKEGFRKSVMDMAKDFYFIAFKEEMR